MNDNRTMTMKIRNRVVAHTWRYCRSVVWAFAFLCSSIKIKCVLIVYNSFCIFNPFEFAQSHSLNSRFSFAKSSYEYLNSLEINNDIFENQIWNFIYIYTNIRQWNRIKQVCGCYLIRAIFVAIMVLPDPATSLEYRSYIQYLRN